MQGRIVAPHPCQTRSWLTMTTKMTRKSAPPDRVTEDPVGQWDLQSQRRRARRPCSSASAAHCIFYTILPRAAKYNKSMFDAYF